MCSQSREVLLHLAVDLKRHAGTVFLQAAPTLVPLLLACEVFVAQVPRWVLHAQVNVGSCSVAVWVVGCEGFLSRLRWRGLLLLCC
jgi:hypothetical protein